MSQITDEQFDAAVRGLHEALGGDGWAYTNYGGDELRSRRAELEAGVRAVAAALSTPPVGAETVEPVAWGAPVLFNNYGLGVIQDRRDDNAGYSKPLFAAPPRSDKANGDWVMVPREPTREMKQAANKAVAITTPDGTWALALDEAARTYAAMIAASPAVPNTVGEDKLWQDIATAPKDGTAFQARIPGHGSDNIIAWSDGLMNEAGDDCGGWQFVEDQEPPDDWTDGVCWAVNENGVPSAAPTHWKPLPASLVSQEAGE